MKTIKQTVLGLALSVLSITAAAQCPTSVSVTVLSNTNNGNVTVSQVFNTATNTVTPIYNSYALYGSSNQYYGNSFGMTGSFSFNNIPSGTYSLCVTDSSYCGGPLQFLSNCMSITITNTIVPPACAASFTQYTDSNCLTHFVNTTPCTYSTSSWNINGTNYYTASPVVNLSNGSYLVSLNASIVGTGVSTVQHIVSVNCSATNTVNPSNNCNAHSSFSIFGDSLIAGNYFAYNTSTGTGNVSYLWNFGDGTSSTQQYPFHQYATPGHYMVCLTVSATNGSVTCSDTYCDSSSVQRVASGFLMSKLNILIPTSINENINAIKNINAFPNPLNDVLTIEIELSALTNSLSYTIVDALGKVKAASDMTDSKTQINTSNLDKGLYFLTVSSNKGEAVKTIKLVK